MPKLRSLPSLVRTVDTRTVTLPPKQKDPIYDTPQYHAWRRYVIGRAGGRCEAKDTHGHRCTRAWPEHRVYADHIVELHDRGQAFDITNGQCLCGMHHTLKTMKARYRRHSTSISGG